MSTIAYAAIWREQRSRMAEIREGGDPEIARPLNNRDLCVLLALAEHVNPNGYCWPGVDRLVDMIGSSAPATAGVRTVQRALASLEAEGLIYVERRGGGRQRGGKGQPNAYWMLVHGATVEPIPPEIDRAARARQAALRGECNVDDSQVARAAAKTSETPQAPKKGDTGDGVFSPPKGDTRDTLPAAGRVTPETRYPVSGDRKGDTGDVPIRMNPQEPSGTRARARGPSGRPPPPPSDADLIRWKDIRKALRKQVSRQAWEDWLKKLTLVSLHPPTLAVTTRFMRESLALRYGPLLQELFDQPVTIITDAPAAPALKESPHAAE